MLAASLDAIRALLKAKFPNITRLYVNSVPAGFIRPSFFIDLVTASNDELCKAMYQSRHTWQIVYFAPVDADGNPDRFNQYGASDTLKAVLMDAMTLTSPEIKNEAGEVTRPAVIYHITEVEGGPRDAEVYITLRLDAEWTRPSETYDLMQDIQHLQRIGEIILN
ncbi:MAG: hypothetical protein NC238_14390 [Dehalobacter sp.]|nr:hypothetical protein [Dehalobacter sp.]